MPKLDDMIMELHKLGFESVEITATIEYAYIKAFKQEYQIGTWIQSRNSTIEITMRDLIEVAKAYNSFDEKTKQKIKQAQQNEVR